jgi:hypothetical protein
MIALAIVCSGEEMLVFRQVNSKRMGRCCGWVV